MLAFIDKRSVWIDEAISISIASQSFGAMAQILQHVDAVHALYYSVLHVWLHLGHGAGIVRSLSLLFAVFASVAISSVAALMFEAGIDVAVLAILATSQFFLFFGDEARSIALSLMTCSFAALAFYRAVIRRRMLDVILCLLFAIVSVYANFVSLLFIAGMAASLLCVRLSRRDLGVLLSCTVAFVAAITPLSFLIHRNSLVQIGWIPRHKATMIIHIISGVLGGSVGTGRISHLSGLFGATCVLTLMMVGIVGGWRYRTARRSVVIALMWFAVPLVLGLAVDQLVEPILIVRYFSFTLIPVAVLAGYGLSLIADRSRGFGAYAIVAVLAATSIEGLSTVQREDWRAVSVFVGQNVRAGDGVVFWTASAILPFEYAAGERAVPTLEHVVFPSGPLLNGVSYPDPRGGFTRALSRRFHRIWLVESHGNASGGTGNPFNALSLYYRQTHRAVFSGVQVLTYSR